MMWIRLGSAVVVIQAIVTALAIPLLKSLGQTSGSVTLVVIATLALLLVPAVFRRPGGRYIGWVVQAFAVYASIGVPSLIILTGLFVALWWYALRIGDRIDADRAAAGQGQPE